jgi:ribosomal protein RSM22 (predicted rRNA methylase)
VTLPDALRQGIELLVAEAGRKEVERAAARLSEAYRAGGPEAERAARSAAEVAGYLATRAPATYAGAAEVFRQVELVRPGWQPASIVDLGAGPGTAAWAAIETWPGIETVELVEAEPEMAQAAEVLARNGPGALRRARVTVGDARAAGPSADLALVSYVIGELEPSTLERFAVNAWERATDTLVVVEPGTTAGYHRVLAVRDLLLGAGASVLAPCPHEDACPLPAGDWCHFSTRLPRSATHRVAKGAERGFEDEKFAYVVLSRSQQRRVDARVIRRPDPRQGHIVLDLCTSAGLEQRTVSRRQGEAYRHARKLRWGDGI